MSFINHGMMTGQGAASAKQNGPRLEYIAGVGYFASDPGIDAASYNYSTGLLDHNEYPRTMIYVIKLAGCIIKSNSINCLVGAGGGTYGACANVSYRPNGANSKTMIFYREEVAWYGPKAEYCNVTTGGAWTSFLIYVYALTNYTSSVPVSANSNSFVTYSSSLATLELPTTKRGDILIAAQVNGAVYPNTITYDANSVSGLEFNGSGVGIGNALQEPNTSISILLANGPYWATGAMVAAAWR